MTLSETDSLLRASAAGCTQVMVCVPVRRAGRVVDLQVEHLSESYQRVLYDQLASISTAAAADPVGWSLSELFPWSVEDGTHTAICAVAEGHPPFSFDAPGRAPRRRILVRPGPAGRLMLLSRDASTETGGQDISGARWERAFGEAPLGVAVTAYDGRMLEVNRALCSLFGRSAEELLGNGLADFSHPDDADVRLDREVLHRDGRFEMCKRYVAGRGSSVWARLVVTVIEEQGEVRLLCFLEDIGGTVHAQQQLERSTSEDVLTGLPNRAEVRRHLRAALVGGRPALLLLDLDHFKVVNDSLGHDAGDQLLRQVARTLCDVVGERGIIGRTGGDEFVVLVPETGAADLLAEEVVAALTGTVRIGSRDVTVGVSVGLAVARPGSGDDGLMRDADTALHAAKRNGRGRVVTFDVTLRNQALARLDDEQALRTALSSNQLVVHYQPIWDRAGHLRAVEALVRWQHPTRGLLLPAAFLSVAEEAGLLPAVGRQVLHQACRDLVDWRAALPDLHVGVNVAPQHLLSGLLVHDVREALQHCGLPGEVLDLELTESAVVSGEQATSTLQELRTHGCRIALDDFGTGFSSLAYLRDFPVDVLKVDRSFVTGASSKRGATLLRGICELGRSLGLVVVAEGVETEAEHTAVLGAGAHLVQGYLLGRPAPAAALTAQVASGAGV